MTIDVPLNGFGNRNTNTGEREVFWFLDMNETLGTARGTPRVHPATIGVNGALVITGNPTSQTVEAGNTAMFSVSTTGDAASFRWRHNGNDLSDGGNISGVATRELTVSPADTADAGTYDVVVRTSGGFFLTSQPATLTVTCPIPGSSRSRARFGPALARSRRSALMRRATTPRHTAGGVTA